MSLEYKKYGTFFSFVIVTGLLWFAFKYKEIYTQHISVAIEWINVPEDLKIKDQSTYYIDVELTGSGFSLLKSKYFAPKVALDFNKYVAVDSLYIFSPQRATGAIKEQLSSNFKVEYIDADSFALDVMRFVSKKVPLVKDFEVSYGDHLQPLYEPYFEPDSVNITGNDALIDEMDKLQIELEDIMVVDTLYKKEIDLKSLFSEIKTEPSIVEFIVTSGVMTEGSFMVPINIINNKGNSSIKIIPSEVEVVFTYRLKDHDAIQASDFMINVDYNSLKNDYSAVNVNVEVLNDKVVSKRHNPQQVQILLMQ
ncbi:hypothetical protein [Nonlabens sp.]|uniref:hypothetical protein n=1 Tax=Nonlabens sp. TaxID=1888209 RepID=UPI003F6A0F2D